MYRADWLGRATATGTGSWPPENPPFVKSANGGVGPNAWKKWHFGNGATKDTCSAGSASWSAPAIVAGSNPSIRDPTRSWTRLSAANTTSSRNRAAVRSAVRPYVARLHPLPEQLVRGDLGHSFGLLFLA